MGLSKLIKDFFLVIIRQYQHLNFYNEKYNSNNSKYDNDAIEREGTSMTQTGEGTAGNGNVPAGVSGEVAIDKDTSDVIDKLTRAQKRNVESLDNIINNNLKEQDFSGTLRDLQDNPVPKPNGGFWDHKTEMIQSHNALQGIKNGLEGSLKNPNLDPAVKQYLQNELYKTNFYINEIEELFKPFGGVK